MPSVHSREGYGRLARELAGSAHPWRRELRGPDPELTFDLLLSSLLTPDTRVLEAGCGHGPDARRFGPFEASWTAYDFIPAFPDRRGWRPRTRGFTNGTAGARCPPACAARST